MSDGETVRLTVGSVAHGGHCVARHDGRAVFVRHALPGEVVDAVVTEGGDDARFWRADCVTVVEASPDRVPSVWPEAGPGGVGGGELAHVALPAQRQWKLDVLTDAFARFAKQEFPGVVSPAPGDTDRQGLAYRTRVTAVAGASGHAAMRKHRSWDAVELESMPLAVPAAERILLGTRLEPGERFTVTVASSGEVAVAIDGQPAPSVSERVTTASGAVDYRVRADGFWQVHVEAPALLVNTVLEQLGDAQRVLDLYAGAGLFGAAIAAQGRDVTLVEFDRRAAKDAQYNVRPWPHARVVAGDVRRTLASGEIKGADAVVLDPPRSGAGAKTLDTLVALKPGRVVYVACDPVALARDVALLAERGYELEQAQGFDLFPMTHHVETVATFIRS
jgi:tRNA/tmRNA/rRNA uracil-C5-methylase (TrmA/RlmC/RlmD family)